MICACFRRRERTKDEGRGLPGLALTPSRLDTVQARWVICLSARSPKRNNHFPRTTGLCRGGEAGRAHCATARVQNAGCVAKWAAPKLSAETSRLPRWSRAKSAVHTRAPSQTRTVNRRYRGEFLGNPPLPSAMSAVQTPKYREGFLTLPWRSAQTRRTQLSTVVPLILWHEIRPPVFPWRLSKVFR